MKLAYCEYPEFAYKKVGEGIFMATRVAEHNGQPFLVVFQTVGDRYWHRAIAVYRVEVNPESSVLEPVTGAEFSEIANLAEKEMKRNVFGD